MKSLARLRLPLRLRLLLPSTTNTNLQGGEQCSSRHTTTSSSRSVPPGASPSSPLPCRPSRSSSSGSRITSSNRLTSPEFYDHVADRYDRQYTSPVAHAEDRTLYGWLGSLDGLDVLDVGCGTGAVLDHAKGSPRLYLGVDPSPRMIEHARAKHPHGFFVAADAERVLPDLLADGFDLTVAMWSLSYLDPQIVDDMFRVLRPGGRFFAVAYTPRYIRRKAFLCDGVDHEAYGWTARTLHERMSGAGFADITVRGFRFTAGVVPSASLMRTASAVLPATFAQTLVVEAVKP